ncbi:hypothetical protein ACROYT_G034483 [Oculina patagonica]
MQILLPGKKLIMPKRLISKMYEEISHGIRVNTDKRKGALSLRSPIRSTKGEENSFKAMFVSVYTALSTGRPHSPLSELKLKGSSFRSKLEMAIFVGSLWNKEMAYNENMIKPLVPVNHEGYTCCILLNNRFAKEENHMFALCGITYCQISFGNTEKNHHYFNLLFAVYDCAVNDISQKEDSFYA